MKFCRDCRHVRPPPDTPADYRFARCTLFEDVFTTPYLVTGARPEEEVFLYCTVARSEVTMCGRTAQKFEAKTGEANDQ